MPIIAHICDNVKEYQSKGKQIIITMIASGQFLCPICFQPLRISSSYERDIKETGETIEVMVLRCAQRCEKGNALLPDFISPWKQYSIGEIETVISEAQHKRVSDIGTKANESTVYRWKRQLSVRITAAISVIKAIFIGMGAAVSELKLDQRSGFAELESLLDASPRRIRHGGTTLGLANLWLGGRPPPAYI